MRFFPLRTSSLNRSVQFSAVAYSPGLLIGSERQEVVRRYLHHLDLTVEHSAFDAEDQAMAMQGDRQGLGLSQRHVPAGADQSMPGGRI